jgi:hypothetical protein
MIPEPLTPLQESAARTGRRFWRVLTDEGYLMLCGQIDERHGFPAGVGTQAVTLQGLPPIEQAQRSIDGEILVSLETWRILPADEVMAQQAEAAGMVVEITDEEGDLVQVRDSKGVLSNALTAIAP